MVRASRSKKPKKKPSWDAASRQLRWGTAVILEFRREAPDQMAVLDLFEMSGWPSHVDATGLIPRGVNGKRWIRDTVNNLNRRLRGIRFHADTSNHAIGWGLA